MELSPDQILIVPKLIHCTIWSQDSHDVLKLKKTCAGINSSEKSVHKSMKQQSTGSTYHEKPLLIVWFSQLAFSKQRFWRDDLLTASLYIACTDFITRHCRLRI